MADPKPEVPVKTGAVDTHCQLFLIDRDPAEVVEAARTSGVVRVLDEGSAEHVVIHCFSGDAEIAGECVARGYWISFAGNITYPKNEHLRRAAARAPSDRIVVETDAPFLSPQRHRGTDNEPANVIETIEAVAQARGTTFEDVVATTTTNARALFPGLR